MLKMTSTQFRKKAVKESGEQAAIIELCIQLGFVVWRVNSGAMLKSYTNKAGVERKYKINLSPEGTPDVVGYMPKGHPKKMPEDYVWPNSQARPFFWECKRSVGKTRPAQKEFIDKAINGGCFAGIGTFKDFERKLREEFYIK